ncbi:hypothetical protein GF360_01365 [candidate division WWE3 bacterium]|nr:hypothetical protein [candidate division WWE3 bacterium]
MWTFEKITSLLRRRGIAFEEIHFMDDGAVSARAADTSKNNNYDPDKAIKTLVVVSGDFLYGVVLRADSRIDSIKLKKLIGKWSVVSLDALEDLGFVPGGVNPFVLDFPVFADAAVLDLPFLSMGAGSRTKGINVSVSEFEKNLDYKVIDIKENVST